MTREVFFPLPSFSLLIPSAFSAPMFSLSTEAIYILNNSIWDFPHRHITPGVRVFFQKKDSFAKKTNSLWHDTTQITGRRWAGSHTVPLPARGPNVTWWLTMIWISLLQTCKSYSLLTYMRFRAHFIPLLVLTRKTIANPPAGTQKHLTH